MSGYPSGWRWGTKKWHIQGGEEGKTILPCQCDPRHQHFLHSSLVLRTDLVGVPLLGKTLCSWPEAAGNVKSLRMCKVPCRKEPRAGAFGCWGRASVIKDCPLVSFIPTAVSAPRAPKVDLLSLVTEFCPGDRCLPGSQNGLMAPVVFLTFLPFRSLLNFHVVLKRYM